MTAATRDRDHADLVPLHLEARFPPVKVMRTWYRTQTFPRHTHPYFTLGVMLRGVGTLWCEGTTRLLHRGDVVVIAPGDVHTGGLGADGGVLSYVALQIPTEIVERAARSHDRAKGPEHIRSTVIRDPAIAAELHRVDRALTDGDHAAASTAAMVAIDLISCRERPEARTHLGVRDEPPFVRTARAIIEDSFANNEKTSLEALGASAGVSPFHLVREFTRAIGLSPHQYLIQTRVRRACELLAARSPISHVAATVGFVDQSHLTAHFRRYVGATPAMYQRGVGKAKES